MVNKLAKSESGFKFLCTILRILYKVPEKKMSFLSFIEEGTPLSKEQTTDLLSDWVLFSGKTGHNKKNREQLEALLNQYYGKDINVASYFYDIDNFSRTDSEKKLKNKFHNIFVNQNGPLPDMLAGIAMTLTLGIGYQGDSQFFLGWKEVRQILTKSLSILEIANAEFLPDKCFTFVDGNPPEDLFKLFFLSLFGALKSVYPHKQTQTQSNIEAGKRIITQFIYESKSTVLLESLKQVNEAAAICADMWKAFYEKSQEVYFPNGKCLKLKDFYTIPGFEPMERSSKYILRCDKGFMVRTIVIGNKGCGKTILTKAVVCACQTKDLSDDYDSYQEYASKLGMDQNQYLPLLLDCKRIQPDVSFETIDLIDAALEQLVQLVRTTKYHDCLEHWSECHEMILEYCRQRAKDASLLLIIDDFSSLESKYYEPFLSRLRSLGTDQFPRLHILITSQRLTQSLMHQFGDYNRVEITPLNEDLLQTIATLSELGVSYKNFEVYQKLFAKNRYVVQYVNSPAHLIKLLSYPFEGTFDIEHLLELTMEEQLEQHSGTEVQEADCREFLTILAVNIAENKGIRNNRTRIDCQSIPMNITNKKYLDHLRTSFDDPEQIWQFIRDKMILICPNGNINSFMFSNRLFYYSLVADYYLDLLSSKEIPSMLHRFNYMSSEDFSYIIVMIFKRLCWKDRYEDNLSDGIEEYHIKLFIQSIAAYIISRDDLTDMYHCLAALNDILYDETIRQTFTHYGEDSRRKKVWNILRRSYAECYRRYCELADDTVLIEKLKTPDC